jgi:PAS domain S-box-containing protein
MEANELKVLAIDDNHDNLTALKAVIEDAFPGTQFLAALNGRTGIALARAEDPDVILLDIIMPGMDGFAVCRELKRDECLRLTPIVFLTALKTDRESRIKALEAGAEAFLSKPVDEQELTAQIMAMAKIKAANVSQLREKERLAALVAERTRELQSSHDAMLSLVENLKAENKARKRSEAELRESEEKFRELVENINDVMFLVDTEGIITYVSPPVRTLAGYAPEDLVGHRFSEITHPEDLPGLQRNLRDTLENRIEPSEFRYFNKAGQTRWARTSSRPISKGGGSVTGIRGIFSDITERKRAEEAVQASLREKEILLREIHHRVKNNMQVISSLFNLQAGHIADEEARRMLKEGQLRIRSMALVHEKLYRSHDLSKIEFGAYLQSLSAYLFQFFKVDADRIRLETDLEDVFLDINSAVPCGLLISELITNALKYAFPGDRKGVIGIRLRRSKDGTVELRVSDDGAGFPETVDFHRTESLGLQIVDLLVGQLEGTIELERKKGAVFTIAFRELGYKTRA